MILEALLGVVMAVVRGIVSMFGTMNPPTWMLDMTGDLRALVGQVSSVGAWVPWSVVGTVVASVMACLVAGFTIRLVRIVVSYLTAGGGAAG